MRRWGWFVVAMLAILGAVGLAWWSVLVPRATRPSVSPDEMFLPLGVSAERIPVLRNPRWDTVQEADVYLDPAGLGIAVTQEGVPRFYPFQILSWHAGIEDEVNGVPVLGVYCPLCATGVLFDRRHPKTGEALTFALADVRRAEDLLLVASGTRGLWSRTVGKAVTGPDAGASLALYPAFENKTWAEWKRLHPTGQVLSRKTGFARDYTRSPLAGRALAPNESVAGVVWRGAARAYPVGLLERGKAMNGELGGSMVLMLPDPLGGVRAFLRPMFGDRPLAFTAMGNDWLNDGREGTWDWSGLALSGPLKGTRLERIPAMKTVWFVWAAAYPETEVWVP